MSATSSDPLVVAKVIAGSHGGVQEAVLTRLDAGEKLAEVFALQGSSKSELQVFFRFTPANEVAHFMDTGVLAFVDSMKGEVTGVVDPYTLQPERRVGRPFVAVSALKTAMAAADDPSMKSIVDRETKFFSALGLQHLIFGGGGVLHNPTDTACSTGILSASYSGVPYRRDDTEQETTGRLLRFDRMKPYDGLSGRHTPRVLIIAPADDAHACVVAKRLEALDAEPIVLDRADFPREWQLSVSHANGESPRFVLRRGHLELDEENLLGVWWRRPRSYVPSDDVQEPHLRRLVTSESRAAFEGWLHCLGDRVINPVAADRAAAHKLLQLQYANAVGLSIPRSLVTNSPAEARAFFEDIGPNTIYKTFTATNWAFLATNRISPDAMEHLDSVSYAPVIFQEEIRKIADIRVNVLDGQIFAILIKQPDKDAPIDWRVDPAREYFPHVLPEQIKAALVALIDKLGLRFAACDLGRTDAGEYVFFEANTGGQWLFGEIMADQPISWAFARALLGRERPSMGLNLAKAEKTAR